MAISTVQLEELPYHPDSCTWFLRLRDLPRPLFLDSCYPHSSRGRFDILLADPRETIDFTCEITTSYKDIVKYFHDLQAAWNGSHCDAADTVPFCGGLAGYLDYEFGLPLQHLAPAVGAGARVGLYDWALVQDHVLQRCLFVCLPGVTPARRKRLLDRLREPQPDTRNHEDFALTSGFGNGLPRDAYQQAFRQVQRYIHAGDCYQVNLARCFSADFAGDPWNAYQGLRGLAAAPFAAYHDCGDEQLLCLSPERFLRVSGRHVETRPIKGTRGRSSDPGADRLAAEDLQRSPKDRAENLMIVDLLRNDIGRSCRPGSIQVDGLFELESYPSVHHLVSTVSGELRADCTALDLLRDSFPGGSITGAPKRRAMEIIGELEPAPRRAYCGSVFYLSADGQFDSNIAIRSLLCRDGVIHCWGGGGLVSDSNCQLEYQETWDKVGRYLEHLEQTALRA
ncbi:MAG: aminodeoxychorismate synthase component I [Halieaceae bacterium]|nr:aminodeoxychorismate synthase component I [Halieaceae bacterium]